MNNMWLSLPTFFKTVNLADMQVFLQCSANLMVGACCICSFFGWNMQMCQYQAAAQETHPDREHPQQGHLCSSSNVAFCDMLKKLAEQSCADVERGDVECC